MTLEENMELARKFVQEQFVTKGMIADLAFHSPEKEAVSYTHLVSDLLYRNSVYFPDTNAAQSGSRYL